MPARQFDIVFVVPAFSEVHAPALGVSVLASQCKLAGLRPYVHYANLDLWRHFPEAYEFVSKAPNEMQLGEAVFAPHAFSPCEFDIGKALSVSFARGEPPSLDCDQKARLYELVGGVDDHLDRTATQLLKFGSPVIGMTSSFQQNAASLAVARRIKDLDPSVLLIMGGANVEGDMGRALLEIAPQIDVVFSGEADLALPEFLRDYVARRVAPERFVECGFLRDMTHAASPDYSDYYSQLEKMSFTERATARFPHFLPFETSRGCWWGAKHHCSFCGLNRQGMAYRKKADDAVVRELTGLHARWGELNFAATDNIIGIPSKSSLFDRLGRSGIKFNFFFETKANLDAVELDLLRSAGVRAIQPGIEALSTSILRRIDKGLKAPHVIRLLRDAIALEIEVYWNLFSEIPDDCDEDYNGLANLIESLVHLRPPVGIGPIRVDRFSPYFERPGSFGIDNLTPFESYLNVYPPEADLKRIAYHFEYERRETVEDNQHRSDFVSAAEAWRKRWEPRSGRPRISVETIAEEGAIVHDSRSLLRPVDVEISALELELLKSFANPCADARRMEAGVDKLIKHGFVVPVDGALVSVVPMAPERSCEPLGWQAR